MLAIVQTGGKQFPVREGDTITIEKLEAEPGTTVTIEAIAAFDPEGQIASENPTVEVEILRHFKDRKVIVFKKKRRKGFHKKFGHRQPHTTVRVAKIA